MFVLALEFSRRGFYWGAPNERLSSLLEAHKRAFEHFDGHTREHLTIGHARCAVPTSRDTGCAGTAHSARLRRSLGLEPLVCQPYRACTNGKVESGVKYMKGNFPPGRTFIDSVDFSGTAKPVERRDRRRAYPWYDARANPLTASRASALPDRDLEPAELSNRRTAGLYRGIRLPRQLRYEPLLRALHADRSGRRSAASAGGGDHLPSRRARRHLPPAHGTIPAVDPCLSMDRA